MHVTIRKTLCGALLVVVLLGVLVSDDRLRSAECGIC